MKVLYNTYYNKVDVIILNWYTEILQYCGCGSEKLFKELAKKAYDIFLCILQVAYRKSLLAFY